VLQFAIDPQLDAAHGQQEKPCLGLSRPDQVADPKLPLPEAGVSDLVSVYSTPL
jgi:hypothetical protein